MWGLVCLLLVTSYVGAHPIPARVRVPVADLLYEPAQTLCPTQSVTEFYQNLGLGDQQCARAYQLLLQEPVLIVAERGPEVQVAVPQITYLVDTRVPSVYTNLFWMQRSELLTEVELQAQGVDLANLPAPLDYTQPDLTMANQRTVTLTQPVFSPELQHTLSAGTRLVIRSTESDPAVLSVWAYSSQKLGLVAFNLPAGSYLRYQPTQSWAERRLALIKLLRSWIQSAPGLIPYVYGGASVTRRITLPANQAYLVTKPDGIKLYQRQNYLTAPQTGYDCSCLISRAAQIVGMPYFYKNSATIERNLSPITELNQLENGDLLWHRGHIMVVSDVAQGLLIEARGYQQGFGCLHEIPLRRIYVGINTFADLWQAIQTKAVVKTLDDQGRPFGAIQQFKLLKLVPSVSYN